MDTDDRGPVIFGVAVALLAVSAVTVALRCYVRVRLLHVFRWEDWMALATLGFFAFYCACVFESVRYGAGKHITDVPTEYIPISFELRWIGEIAYIFTSIFVKFTVGLFLLRICSHKWQRAVIWAVLAVVILFNIFYLLIAILQCRPITYFWLRFTDTKMQGTCVSIALATGSTYAATAVNAVTDWTLGLLPIALVWNLHLGTKAKCSIAGVLALGILASAATLMRLPYVWQLTHSTDGLYVFTDFMIWSTVENGVGLIASSVATLRPLFKILQDGTTRGSKSRTGDARSHARRTTITRRSIPFHCRGVELVVPQAMDKAHLQQNRTTLDTVESGWTWFSDSTSLEEGTFEWGSGSEQAHRKTPR
ncbi:hypothetical protein BX600DRAFT_212667 [Xylariales sp. PMI_506]|nr:hypothetical protein BX600DRAFT_212667 [Xylariales sp. PMI_506]